VHLAKEATKEELQDFVDGLTADQMRKLSAFYNSMPRLEHKMTVKNPKTEVESEVTLKGLASFFG
jgi:cytochrome c553